MPSVDTLKLERENIMRLFTDADVKNSDSNTPTIYPNNERDLLHAPLVWQERGLRQTVSGYGQKLTTKYKINFNGKLYRLYMTHISNAASTWFTAKGKKIFVN